MQSLRGSRGYSSSVVEASHLLLRLDGRRHESQLQRKGGLRRDCTDEAAQCRVAFVAQVQLQLPARPLEALLDAHLCGRKAMAASEYAIGTLSVRIA